MAQYKTGRVAISHDSIYVSGAGTTWNSSVVQEDYLFMIKGEPNIYEIHSLTDKTHLRLKRAYQNLNGTAINNQQYLIVQDYTTNLGLPLVQPGDWNWTTLLKRAVRKIDKALYHYGADEVDNAGFNFIRFEMAPSGTFTEVSGGWSYYTPHSSIPNKAGILFYDEYYRSLLFCKGDMASAAPLGSPVAGEEFYYTKWYKIDRWA